MGLLVLLAPVALAQRLHFGKTFDKVTGKLVEAGDVFATVAPQQLLAVKFTPRGGALPIDTLYVVVKNLDGVAGRFIMKRNKSKTEGNAIIRLKAEGIYRVYVYNPSRRAKPVIAANLFLTSPSAPTRAALIERQRQILIARGLIKDVKAVPDSTSTDTASAADDDDSFDVGDLDDAEDDEDGLDDDEDFDDLFADDEDMLDEDDLLGEFEDVDELEDDLDIDLEDIN